jgi:formiminotetrahydrofolate cyclodeaminase
MIEKPFSELVQSFAAKTPTPGGGAAAAMSASLGTSLFLMAIRFSRGKKATLEFDSQLEEIEKRLVQSLARLLPMAERDCASFDHVSKAYGLPKETDEEKAIRARAIEEGMLGAMVVPEEALCMVRDVMRAMSSVLELVSRNIVSDLGSGSEILTAAAESAFLNVRINANYLKDKDKALAALQTNDVVMTDIRELHRAFRARVDQQLS